ncbi:MAG: LLM class flavin-dependent oxidoreductase [Streptosporangiales bacterium]|nr:LLM class flavin-dependent oxidoreductase [Streptosporangiales bacterium]
MPGTEHAPNTQAPYAPPAGTGVRLGIMDHIDADGRATAEQYEDRLRLTELYDRLDYRAYHLAEHHGTPLGVAPSPNVFLSAVAQRTERLRIGTFVTTLPLYHPVRLLEEIAMLDHLSGGRLEVGLGRGISPVEVGYYGIDHDETRARFAEYVELLLRGLTEPELDFHGEFYTVEKVPMVVPPLQRPTPPLWYGIADPKRARWAAERGLNIAALLAAPAVRPITDAFRREWDALGRPAGELPLTAITRNMVVAPTREEAMRIAERAFVPWRANIDHTWVKAGLTSPFEARTGRSFAEWHGKGGAFAGTPAEALAYLRDQTGEAGVTYVAVDPAFGDMTYDEAAQTARLLAEEVAPTLAESPPGRS